MQNCANPLILQWIFFDDSISTVIKLYMPLKNNIMTIRGLISPSEKEISLQLQV